MIYENSKGEKKPLNEMNDFELKATVKKADSVLNWITGVLIGDTSESEAVVRYIRIIRDNLWQEVSSRNVTGIDEHFHETFPHLGEADATAIKNFIKTNFVLKK